MDKRRSSCIKIMLEFREHHPLNVYYAFLFTGQEIQIGMGPERMPDCPGHDCVITTLPRADKEHIAAFPVEVS